MRELCEVENSRIATDSTFSVALELPEDLVWFEGHFPKKALLPGVVQLRWVLHYASLWLGRVTLREIVTMKFVRPVLPLEALQLRLTKGATKDGLLTLQFEYVVTNASEATTVSLGRLKVRQ